MHACCRHTTEEQREPESKRAAIATNITMTATKPGIAASPPFASKYLSITIQLLLQPFISTYYSYTYTSYQSTNETAKMGKMAEVQRKLLEVSSAPKLMMCRGNAWRNDILTASIANDGSRSYGYQAAKLRLVGRESLSKLPTRYLSPFGIW